MQRSGCFLAIVYVWSKTMKDTYSTTFREALINNKFPIVMTLLFTVVAGTGMYHHEMWRDEFEIFMIMRDIPDFFALFPDIRPLPNLYLALVYAVVKLCPYPAVFQMFHLLIITIAVFIFNKYSPFNYYQKILFTLSYFVLFEYGIISREYSMALLLLFLSVFLITRRKQNYILISCSLFLLANHHLYGVFMSLSLLIYIGLHLKNRAGSFSSQEKKQLIISSVLLIITSLVLAVQYVVLIKFNRYSAIFGQAPYFMTLRSIWNVFFPLPDIAGMHFWNTNYLSFPIYYSKHSAVSQFITTVNIAAVSLSVFILLLSISILSKKLPVLITFIINCALQLTFLQYLSVFFIRYQGMLFIIFIYHYWLLSYSDEKLFWPSSYKLADFFSKSVFIPARKFGGPLITFILLIQFCVGLLFYIQDIRYPFSASSAAAKYIKEQKLNDNIIVGYFDYAMQPISAHLNQKIFYPQTGEFQTHVVWLNRNRKEIISQDEILESATRLLYKNKKNVLLILNSPLLDFQKQPIVHASIINNIKLKYLNEFKKTMVDDEVYFLYLIYSDVYSSHR